MASTLTTICVFVPIVFVEGVAGQLFGDQALTVTYSLSVSLIVALTIIPMLASRQLAPAARGSERPAGRCAARLYAVRPGRRPRSSRRSARGLGRVVGLLLAIPFRLFDAAFGWVQRVYPALLDAPSTTGRRPSASSPSSSSAASPSSRPWGPSSSPS